VAGEIAHTGAAFAFPGGDRVGSATDVGREFVAVTSDEVDIDTLCEEDMTFGVRIGKKSQGRASLFGPTASPVFDARTSPDQ